MPLRDRYTLSGRVSSITTYRAQGTFDKEVFEEDARVGVNILYKKQETDKIYIRLYPLAEAYTAIFGDISTLETTSFKIQGELGDVTFEDNCEVKVLQKDKSEYTAAATIKGWINTDPSKLVQTKAGPWNYQYTCEITIDWDETSSGTSVHHKLFINQITR